MLAKWNTIESRLKKLIDKDIKSITDEEKRAMSNSLADLLEQGGDYFNNIYGNLASNRKKLALNSTIDGVSAKDFSSQWTTNYTSMRDYISKLGLDTAVSKALSKMLAANEKKLESIRHTVDINLKEIQGSIKGLESNNETLTKELDITNEKLKKVADENKALSDELKTHKSQKSKEVTELKKKLKESEKAIADLTYTVNSLEAVIQGNQVKISRLEGTYKAPTFLTESIVSADTKLIDYILANPNAHKKSVVADARIAQALIKRTLKLFETIQRGAAEEDRKANESIKALENELKEHRNKYKHNLQWKPGKKGKKGKKGTKGYAFYYNSKGREVKVPGVTKTELTNHAKIEREYEERLAEISAPTEKNLRKRFFHEFDKLLKTKVKDSTLNKLGLKDLKNQGIFKEGERIFTSKNSQNNTAIYNKYSNSVIEDIMDIIKNDDSMTLTSSEIAQLLRDAEYHRATRNIEYVKSKRLGKPNLIAVPLNRARGAAGGTILRDVSSQGRNQRGGIDGTVIPLLKSAVDSLIPGDSPNAAHAREDLLNITYRMFNVNYDRFNLKEEIVYASKEYQDDSLKSSNGTAPVAHLIDAGALLGALIGTLKQVITSKNLPGNIQIALGIAKKGKNDKLVYFRGETNGSKNISKLFEQFRKGIAVGRKYFYDGYDENGHDIFKTASGHTIVLKVPKELQGGKISFKDLEAWRATKLPKVTVIASDIPVNGEDIKNFSYFYMLNRGLFVKEDTPDKVDKQISRLDFLGTAITADMMNLLNSKEHFADITKDLRSDLAFQDLVSQGISYADISNNSVFGRKGGVSEREKLFWSNKNVALLEMIGEAAEKCDTPDTSEQENAEFVQELLDVTDDVKENIKSIYRILRDNFSGGGNGGDNNGKGKVGDACCCCEQRKIKIIPKINYMAAVLSQIQSDIEHNGTILEDISKKIDLLPLSQDIQLTGLGGSGSSGGGSKRKRKKKQSTQQQSIGNAAKTIKATTKGSYQKNQDDKSRVRANQKSFIQMLIPELRKLLPRNHIWDIIKLLLLKFGANHPLLAGTALALGPATLFGAAKLVGKIIAGVLTKSFAKIALFGAAATAGSTNKGGILHLFSKNINRVNRLEAKRLKSAARLKEYQGYKAGGYNAYYANGVKRTEAFDANELYYDGLNSAATGKKRIWDPNTTKTVDDIIIYEQKRVQKYNELLKPLNKGGFGAISKVAVPVQKYFKAKYTGAGPLEGTYRILGDAGNGIKSIFSNLAAAITAGKNNLINASKSFLASLKGLNKASIAGAFRSTGSGLKSGIQGVFSGTKDFFVNPGKLAKLDKGLGKLQVGTPIKAIRALGKGAKMFGPLGIGISALAEVPDLINAAKSGKKGAFKQQLTKSAGGITGSLIGGAIGASALSFIPVVGPIIGGALGAILGDIAGRKLAPAFAKGFGIFTKNVGKDFKSFGKGLADLFGGLMHALTPIGKIIGAVLTPQFKVWGAVLGGLVKVCTWVINILGKVCSVVGWVFKVIGDCAYALIGIFKNLKNWFSNTKAGKWIQKQKENISNGWNTIVNATKDGWHAFQDIFQECFNSLSNWFENSAFGKAWRALVNTGKGEDVGDDGVHKNKDTVVISSNGSAHNAALIAQQSGENIINTYTSNAQLLRGTPSTVRTRKAGQNKSLGACAAAVEKIIKNAWGIDISGDAKDLIKHFEKGGKYYGQYDILDGYTYKDSDKIPEGALIIQDAGGSHKYGHTAVKGADGKFYSDFKQDKLERGYGALKVVVPKGWTQSGTTTSDSPTYVATSDVPSTVVETSSGTVLKGSVETTATALAENGVGKLLNDYMMQVNKRNAKDSANQLVFDPCDVTGSLGCWGIVQLNSTGNMVVRG